MRRSQRRPAPASPSNDGVLAEAQRLRQRLLEAGGRVTQLVHELRAEIDRIEDSAAPSPRRPD